MYICHFGKFIYLKYQVEFLLVRREYGLQVSAFLERVQWIQMVLILILEISKAFPPPLPNKEIVVRFKSFATFIASNTLGLWPEEDIENKISPFLLKLLFV